MQSPDDAGYVGLTPLRGRSNFSMVLNSWIDATLDGRLSPSTLTIVLAVARKGERFHLTRGNVVKLVGMSHTTVSKAFGELIEIGVASHGYRGGQLYGYNLRMDVDVSPAGPESGRSTRPENGLHSKTQPEITSLRSEEYPFPASLRSAETGSPSRATIRTDRTGQVGLDFHSSGPAITDRMIDRIIDDLRKEDLRGDPENDELKRFIAKRIEFIESASWKGKPFATSGKDAERNNRMLVVQLCMSIIRKGADWKTKRRDAAQQRAAEAAQATVDQLWREYDTRHMRDGSFIRVDAYERIVEELRVEQRRLVAIERAKSRRPSWQIEEDFPLDRVARLIYLDKADSYILAEDDRDRRQQIRNRVRELEAGKGVQ